MRRHLLAGPALVAVIASSVLTTYATPAAADTSTLYVNNTAGANCSDTGPGTQTQPYCTIAVAVAAVTAGETINVTGTYTEHVTIARSGATGSPITIMASKPRGATLTGADAGFTVDGQHDVSIANIDVTGYLNGPGIALSHATGISVQSVRVTAASGAVVTGTQLTAVTASSLVNVRVDGQPTMPSDMILDAATSGVVVKSDILSLAGIGIDVIGSNNQILDTSVGRAGSAGIRLESEAGGNIVADDWIGQGAGLGIDNVGATGTAITNNTVNNNCATGIRVAGASSGVSVMNNVATDNGPYRVACDQSLTGQVDIGVYDGATASTVVDYNTAYQTSSSYFPYAWNAPMSGTDFRSASGQGAHDLESNDPTVNDDSADSAAPGFQSADFYGRAPEDNPAVPNAGAGPIAFADRGSVEHVQGPTAQLALRTNGTAGSITADASATTAGWVTIASYAFDFGDGSPVVRQSTPVATHNYAKAGDYYVRLAVTDTNGMQSQIEDAAYCVATAPAAGSSQLNADFDGDGKDDTALFYNYGGGNAGLFTMTTQGCGGAMPPVLRWQGRFANSRIAFVTSGDFNGDGNADIALLRDYGNGHVALLTLSADANGDGGFGAPVTRWDAPFWGSGTQFLTVGDFNGDGKADIALFYKYAYGHAALFTLSGDANGDGGFGAPAARWDAPFWGSGTSLLTSGDFNGDGKTDVALLYNYSYSHVGLYTLTAHASGDGGLAVPTLRWSSRYWGSGTRFMSAGKYRGDDPYADLALFFDYGGGHVSLLLLSAATTGDGTFGSPLPVWDTLAWGAGTRFMTSGQYTGAGRDFFGLLYDYGAGHVALFALKPNANTGGYDRPARQWDGPSWGPGTQALL